MLEFLTKHWVSIVGIVFGILYLYLEYRASILMWAASIAMAAFYVFIFYDTHLYASMGIYIYFFLASVNGWIMWSIRGKNEQTGKDIISRMPKRKMLLVIVSVLVVWAIIYIVLIRFSSDAGGITVGDALTTSLNIVALWMVSRKWAEQWLLLVPANFISAVLLFMQEDILSAFLFFVFFVVSIAGYFNWKRMSSV